MQRLILPIVAAATMLVGSSTTFAQQAGPALTPDQQATIRIVITERLSSEMQGTLPERLAEAVATINSLSPDQRAKIRAIIQSRLGDDVRDGMVDKLSERLADRLGNVPIPNAGTLSPEQRAA